MTITGSPTDTASDLDFGHGMIPAPGHTSVDYEERVDFDRLRRYRLGAGAGGVGGQ